MLSIFNIAIVAIFTIGSWVNRRKSIAHDEDHREPLLREEPPEEPESGLYATGQRSLRNRRYLHSRILAQFPFLLEIWYWLLTYWVRTHIGSAVSCQD